MERSEQRRLSDANAALALAESAENAAFHLNNPISLANALTAKGAALAQLYRDRDALDNYQAAEAIYTEHRLALQQADVQSRSIFLHYVLGEREQAFALAKQTRRNCVALGSASDRPLARVAFSLGFMHKQAGQYSDALAAYAEAHDLHLALNEWVEVARIDINRANIYQEMDRFDLAQKLYQEAENRLHGVEAQQELRGHIESNLGLLAHRQGHYQQAIRWFESAETSLAQNPHLAAMASLRRAIGYHQLGLIPETIALATQAATTFAMNDAPRDQALALQTVGKAQARLGATAEAAAALTQARQLYHEQAAQQDVAETDLELARVALAQGDLERVYELTTALLQTIDANTLPRIAAHCHILRAQARSISIDDIHSALAIATEFRLQDVIALAFWQQAIMFSKDDPNQAWQSFQQALWIIEAQRALIWVDEFQLGFMEEQLAIYQTAIAHLVRFGEHPALLVVLLDALQNAPLPKEQPLGDISAELHSLRQQWHWFNSKLEQRYDQETQANLQNIERQIASASRSHLLQSEADTWQYQRAFDVESAEKWLISIQQTLPATSALLHYFVTEGQSHVIVMSSTQLHHVALGAVDKTNAMLRGWRHHLGDVGLITTHPTSATQLAQRYLQALQAQLIAPLQAILPSNCDQLKIVLPAEWHDLPFAAFFDGNSYLIERFCISYLSSPSAQLHQVSKTPLNRTALLLGNSCDGLLPNSVAETEQVAAVLTDQWQTTVLIEQQTTWQAVQPALAKASLIHCATHAYFRPDNPLFSWLQLADYRMTVTELYEQPLQNRPIVVLSACETGRGTARGGGLAGMVRAWLAAGASSLIVTSWRVEDEATAALIAMFYQQLVADRSPASALQNAQQACVTQHPFFWAGFVVLEG